MTTELTRYLPDPLNKGTALIIGYAELIATRLPANVNPQNFMTACVVEANALTTTCSPKSVAIATFNCAVMGLIPGPALGHAYFVPFKGVCTLMPGYRGFLDLAFGNSFLKDIHCDVVLNGEDFRFWKDEHGPRLLHEVTLDRDLQKQNVLAAYCIYHTTSGGNGIRVVNRRELNKVDTGMNVWKSDYISMALKTPIRRAAKEWKITPSLGRAILLDEQSERGDSQTCEQTFGSVGGPFSSEFSLDGNAEPSGEPEPKKSAFELFKSDMRDAADLDALAEVRTSALAESQLDAGASISAAELKELWDLHGELVKSFEER